MTTTNEHTEREELIRKLNAIVDKYFTREVNPYGSPQFEMYVTEEGEVLQNAGALLEAQPAADDKAGGEPVAHVTVEPLRRDEYKRRVAVNWIKEPVAGPLYTHPQPQAEVPDENRCIRELREYAAKNPGTYIFPGWDGSRVTKYLAAAPKPQDDLPAILKKQTS